MINRGRRFEFVEESYEGNIPAISCDGLVPGSHLDLTHWQGNRTPARYKADTSTEIALNFVVSPEAREKWANAVVVNNHFDTDGVLSVWTLLDPEAALARRDVLVAAAEAGDFDEWPALERGLWLDAAIRVLGGRAGDDSAAYLTVLGQLPDLIDSLDERRDLWGDEWDALQAATAGLDSGRLRASNLVRSVCSCTPSASERLLVRCWPGAFFPGRNVIFWRSSETGGMFDFRYERPRYGWADTIVRPILPAPDGGFVGPGAGTGVDERGSPGMTAICGTERPVTDRPDDVVRRLALLDPC